MGSLRNKPDQIMYNSHWVVYVSCEIALTLGLGLFVRVNWVYSELFVVFRSSTYFGKTADWIRIPFGVISGVGRGLVY